MRDSTQTVTRTRDNMVDANGTAVVQETQRVHTDSSVDSKITAQNVISYIVGIIETLLAIRFVLKLFGANSASGFVHFIYSVTNILTMPFDRIFGVTTAVTGETRSVFEPSILVAMVVYALIGYGISRLFTLNEPRA